MNGPTVRLAVVPPGSVSGGRKGTQGKGGAYRRIGRIKAARCGTVGGGFVADFCGFLTRSARCAAL